MITQNSIRDINAKVSPAKVKTVSPHCFHVVFQQSCIRLFLENVLNPQIVALQRFVPHSLILLKLRV